ncbi:MAG TPA: hypothetical protein VK638_38785 [Edaphobacter sp.]|nr:hypothetical protein [Edaphobacter sp.]
MSDEQQNVNEPVGFEETTTEVPRTTETSREPFEESPVDESAPTDTEPSADEPEAAEAQDEALQIPESLTDAYEDVRVVTLTGGSNVVMAKASVLSNQKEQRISGEFPTAAEALDDAERVLKLQTESYESAAQSNAE